MFDQLLTMKKAAWWRLVIPRLLGIRVIRIEGGTRVTAYLYNNRLYVKEVRHAS